MGQIAYQNRSIEFEVVRLVHFCCPIALTIAPCFCHPFFGHYMRLLIII